MKQSVEVMPLLRQLLSQPLLAIQECRLHEAVGILGRFRVLGVGFRVDFRTHKELSFRPHHLSTRVQVLPAIQKRAKNRSSRLRMPGGLLGPEHSEPPSFHVEPSSAAQLA